MQPKSDVVFDPPSFERLRDRLHSRAQVTRAIQADPRYATPLPEEIGLQLTNRCNLRCETCFQWNESGFHRLLPVARQRDDLDIGIVEKILAATRPARSKVYLWGGEPLVYRDWDRLTELLAEDPRWTVLCTNGLGMDKKLDSLLRLGKNLVSLISVDGFAEENDAVRGKGTFDRVMESIDLLLDSKARGVYQGEVSVSCVISAPMVGKLYEFAEFFEARGVNSVYLVFPWYIPEETAVRMDGYIEERLGWLRERNTEYTAGRPASWHSYTFHVDPGVVPALRDEVARIAARTWKVRVRFQPALEPDEIEGFLAGSERPGEGRTRCLSIHTRLNVLPDGTVTTCKLFPEMRFGDLAQDGMAEVWHGETASRARGTLACGLTPICSKCVQLYLHGS
jgi:MoaA/NifB/PqqE/SkfB family radical SAM enzyme